MAPFMGPNKEMVLKRLKSHDGSDLDITLGKYQPQFVVRVRALRWMLVPLVLDEVAEEQAHAQDIGGNYTHEMTWRSLRPGAPLIEDGSSADFVRKLDGWEGWASL